LAAKVSRRRPVYENEVAAKVSMKRPVSKVENNVYHDKENQNVSTSRPVYKTEVDNTIYEKTNNIYQCIDVYGRSRRTQRRSRSTTTRCHSITSLTTTARWSKKEERTRQSGGKRSKRRSG